ncbi:MAG TPA: SCO family protein [Phenylobacterium sp.]|nr:SCO family protein [Phenylobacterium sp.]
MSRRNLILIGACVAGLFILAGLAWRAGVFEAPPSAGPGGPFQLVDQTGKPVTEAVLKGKWSAVFFGFTYCPDVCPTTLAAMAQAQERLGPKADKLQVVFVSLDPERDTPAQMAAYLANDAFPKGTVGLTGTPEQVAVAAKAYRVFYEKSGTGPDYLINHSTASYLMDPKGRFARVLPYGISPDEIARQISDAMAK